MSTSDERLHYPATERNREPIAAVLERVLPDAGVVLEIASGSGEHSLYFAERLGALTFQPSDPDPQCRASIDAWRASVDEALAARILPALELDVQRPPWPLASADAILCINMIHISPWASCVALMKGAAELLEPGAPLYLYGPYRVGGAHTAPSNASFDASLRSRDPSWGVRDLEAVIEEAAHSFDHVETVSMPANNLSVVFRRR